MAAFKLPRLKANLAIVNSKGQPLDYFLRFWNIEVAPRIEQQETIQDQTLQDIQNIQQQLIAQLALTQQALELAGIAVGQDPNTKTAEAVATIADSWEQGPEVEFVGAAAGTVTVAGSGVYYASGATINFTSSTGQMRLIEIEAGVDTVIGGPWNFTVTLFPSPPGDPQTIIISNPSEINSFSLARTNTGDIKYRIEAILNSGQVMTDVMIKTTVKRV